MSETLIQRGRRLQAAIQAAGGPPPDRVVQYQNAIAALDEAEAGTLGFAPLVWGAVAVLGVIFGYVGYRVGGTAIEETQEALRAVRKVAVGGFALWLGLAVLRSNRSAPSARKRRRRRRRAA